jgi:ribonuclease P protein subunit RPR2
VSKERKGIRNKEIKKVAEERIDLLFEYAEEQAFENNLELSRRYIVLARRIGMKYKIKLKPQYKILFCKNCNNFLLPGKTARVRLKNHKTVIKCLKCNTYKRHPYLKEIKEKRINH